MPQLKAGNDLVMGQRSSAWFWVAVGVLAMLGGGHQRVLAQTAVSNDGGPGYVSLPSGTIPDSNVTIALWVKPNSLADNRLAFWGVQNGCFPSAQMLFIENGKLIFFTGCEHDIRLAGATTLTTGGWQHVALTVDPVGNAVLYLNGALDELHIYNRVLSPGEIGELYDAGKGRYCPAAGGGLVAGYHFDEGSGPSASDFSGFGNTGTLIDGMGRVASLVVLEMACQAPAPGFVTRVGGVQLC